jgi:hypothetical protein
MLYVCVQIFDVTFLAKNFLDLRVCLVHAKIGSLVEIEMMWRKSWKFMCVGKFWVMEKLKIWRKSLELNSAKTIFIILFRLFFVKGQTLVGYTQILSAPIGAFLFFRITMESNRCSKQGFNWIIIMEKGFFKPQLDGTCNIYNNRL